MMGMTHKQAELLSYITDYQSFNKGISPSFDEMCAAIGLKSKAGVHRLLVALVERGLIRRQLYRARAIEIITKPAGALNAFSSAELVEELMKRREAKLAA